jgi:hypothetical protein
VLPALYADDMAAQLTIKDQDMLLDSMQGEYVSRTMDDALTLHFPAITIDGSGTYVNISNAHKAMPKATLGSRLLQLYSLKYYQSSVDEQEDELTDSARVILTTDAGIGTVMDISSEPDALQSEIISKVEAYLADARMRNSFLYEFSRKYPETLQDFSKKFQQGTPCRLSDALAYSRKSFSIYVNVSVTYDIGNGQEVSIFDVPVIFRLMK